MGLAGITHERSSVKRFVALVFSHQSIDCRGINCERNPAAYLCVKNCYICRLPQIGIFVRFSFAHKLKFSDTIKQQHESPANTGPQRSEMEQVFGHRMGRWLLGKGAMKQSEALVAALLDSSC